jgi:hypothetical protein
VAVAVAAVAVDAAVSASASRLRKTCNVRERMMKATASVSNTLKQQL